MQGLTYTQWKVEEPKCSCACWDMGCPQEADDCLVQLLLLLASQGLLGLSHAGAIWSESVLQGAVNGLELSDTGH